MTRQDLQSLARLRMKEAETLLAAGLPDGAYYLAGYAVECGLKACMQEANRDPNFRNHWDVVQQWSEQSRYGRPGSEMAGRLVLAIGDKRNGVMAWTKRHW